MDPQDYKYWRDRPVLDKGDWLDGYGNWLTGYAVSITHPHRKLIVDAINKVGSIESVLELGCSSGPNLVLIKDNFPDIKLAGIDANACAVDFVSNELPLEDVRVGNIEEPLPWPDKSHDLVLADACLMYINPDHIGKVIREIDRVTKKAVIVIDRYDNSPLGRLTSGGAIWARNYTRLLANYGFKVEKVKLTAADWPTSKGWIKDGYLWTATRK